MEKMYVEPLRTETPTVHLKWIDGVLFQMWKLTNYYGTIIEWREVPYDNAD